MPTVINKTDRLINTHDMTPIPPGVPTELSAEAMAHADIQQAIADGLLVDAESSIDPPVADAEAQKPDQPSPTFNTGPQEDKSGEAQQRRAQPAQPQQPQQRPAPTPTPPQNKS